MSRTKRESIRDMKKSKLKEFNTLLIPELLRLIEEKEKEYAKNNKDGKKESN
jgi:hypothetical protein